MEQPSSRMPWSRFVGAATTSLTRVFLQEDVNFLLTNRIPRRYATLFMGWFSRIESPLLTRLALAMWRPFADLRLDEARTHEFNSLRECFTRELRPGARPIDPDPDVVVSPCDAIVGACGRIDGTSLIQAKGFPYTLMDLLGDRELVDKHRDGWFVTLRLTASMYHRFHAPCDARIRGVTYVSGDTWNVNPIALRRVERLFCKNERVILDLDLPEPGRALTLVPVAAILVASVQLRFLDHPLDLRYRGPNRIACDVAARRGEELGYFQHGSTIVVFASGGARLCESVVEGATIRVGRPLFRWSAPGADRSIQGEPDA